MSTQLCMLVYFQTHPTPLLKDMDSPSSPVAGGARRLPPKRSSSPSTKKNKKNKKNAPLIIFRTPHVIQIALSATSATKQIPTRISGGAVTAGSALLHRVCGALLRSSFKMAQMRKRQTIMPEDVVSASKVIRADGHDGGVVPPFQTVAQVAGDCMPPARGDALYKKASRKLSSVKVTSEHGTERRVSGASKASGRQIAARKMGSRFNPYSESGFRAFAKKKITTEGSRISFGIAYQVSAMAIACLRHAVSLGAPTTTKTLTREFLLGGILSMSGPHKNVAEAFALAQAERMEAVRKRARKNNSKFKLPAKNSAVAALAASKKGGRR